MKSYHSPMDEDECNNFDSEEDEPIREEEELEPLEYPNMSEMDTNSSSPQKQLVNQPKSKRVIRKPQYLINYDLE